MVKQLSEWIPFHLCGCFLIVNLLKENTASKYKKDLTTVNKQNIMCVSSVVCKIPLVGVEDILSRVMIFEYPNITLDIYFKALSNNKTRPSLSCQTVNLGFKKNLGCFAVSLWVDTCAITTFSRPLLLSEGYKHIATQFQLAMQLPDRRQHTQSPSVVSLAAVTEITC